VLMPVVRQGPAPDGDRNGGNQPAHQSRSTDVQRARLLPCTTLLLLTTNAQRGAEHYALPLENGHQSVAVTAGEFLIDRAELLESGGLTTQAFDPVPLVGGNVSAELQARVEAQVGD